MEIVLIAAVSRNNVIGKGGRLPWNIPEDLKRFRKLTLGSPVIMGRKTFESIGKPLDQRENVVITRNRSLVGKGFEVCSSFDEAVEKYRDRKTVFVIGGRSVFEAALPVADRLEITEVHNDVDGDVYFPEIDFSEWVEKERQDSREYSFVTYVRNEK